MPQLTVQMVEEALVAVIDPELNRSIAELGMVGPIAVDPVSGDISVEIKLTIEGCPWRSPLEGTIRQKLAALPGIGQLSLSFRAMTKEELEAVKAKLRGPQPVISFNQPGSRTRVIAVTSGKGGVGKSTVTANLAVALAEQGYQVGVMDADIYGFSQPRMLGVEGHPTPLDDMLLPVEAHGVKVISVGMLLESSDQPVAMRGPMLHQVLQTFLTQVYWGELDYLLVDLPPGTGDVSLSVAQLLPGSQVLVVTTPQVSAAEIAQRSGAMTAKTGQSVIGVVENMSWLEQADGSRLEVFGSGGGEDVARRLGATLKRPIPLLGQVPLDISVRMGSDIGKPIVLDAPNSPAALALRAITDEIVGLGQVGPEPSSAAGVADAADATDSADTAGLAATAADTAAMTSPDDSPRPASSSGWKRTRPGR